MLIEFDGRKPSVAPTAFIAPSATLIGDVTVGEEASVWFGAQLRGDLGKIIIGERSSIQDNSVVHADRDQVVTVEADVTVGHSTVLHNCTIKRGAVIGMHATVLDNAVVGEQAVVAAGSVVTDGTEIPPRYLAAGVPARVKKPLSGNSLHWVEVSADAYVQLARSYRRQGIDRRASD